MVGESGCGKSVTAMSLAGLLPRSATVDGSVRLRRDRARSAPTSARLRSIRGRDVAYIFQEPMTSLNPVFTVGPPDRRGAAGPQRLSAARRPRRGRSNCSSWSASRPPSERVERLPAPALRRHAPARDDRDGGRLRPEGADRRRADHRARRHDPGRHPRRAAGAARPARHQHRADHPRPRRGRRPRRPGGGDVRRTRRRDGRASTNCSPDPSTPTPPACLGASPAAGRHAGTHRLNEIPGLVPVLPDSPTPAPSPTAAQSNRHLYDVPAALTVASTVSRAGTRSET